MPVAHWLIENIKPAKIVELGTHYGVSFFSFCEAAKKYSQGTFLYAVDTWYGDTQAGEYGNEVYESVAEHHERHHRARSRLIRSTFDEAANHFENSSIDLIHIDGFHTYEAVRNDFEVGKKLKEGGTFLFHDWNVREKDFGVWKLWEEIKRREDYVTIELANGHGLGIATKSMSVPEWHNELKEELAKLNTKGALLAQLNREREKLDLCTEKLKNERGKSVLLQDEIDSLKRHAYELERIIKFMEEGMIYKLLKKAKKLARDIVKAMSK